MYKTTTLTEMSAKYELNLNIILKIQYLMSLGIKLGNEKGPWVAGGSMQKCFTNSELESSDIDIFIGNKELTKMHISSCLRRNGFTETKTNDKVLTFHKDGLTVQTIIYPYYNVYELLNDFDFTVVKCAFDGENFIYHTNFIRDNLAKKLKFDFKIKTKNNTAARVIKYTKRGYKLSIQDAINLTVLNRETTSDLYKQKEEVQVNVKSFYS